MINENIALAKSILNRANIKQDSDEYKDYLKIREICGANVGYVGILTRIRFIDNVTDIDELTSIFNAFKESKMDIAKINKLSYDEILDIFYDKIFNNKNVDYEVVYSDSEYTYYKVYTYNGVLKLSSPSWCLKTKSNYDRYMELYGTQYIVIQNKYKNRIITPNDNYIRNYSSSKGFIRYGFTLRHDSNTVVTWIGFDDNNAKVVYDTDRYTSFGVLCTILNLEKGEKESYYSNFYGCERVQDSNFLKVTNKSKFVERLQIVDIFGENDIIYALFSKTYSYYPVILVFNENYPFIFLATSKEQDSYSTNDFRTLKSKSVIGFFEKYAIESNNIMYLGVKIKKGLINIDDVMKNKRFIKKVDKWLIFERNENFYVVVNSNPDYILPLLTNSKHSYHYIDNPMFFFINKKTLKIHNILEYKKGDVYDTIVESLREKKKGILDFLNFNA